MVRRWWARHWLLLFFGLVIVLGMLLSRQRPEQVSVGRLNQAIPAFALEDLTQTRRYTEADLRGQWALLNIWASWCSPCQQEHPVLMQIHETKRLPIYGIAFKDDLADARTFIAEHGNPYAAILWDDQGQLGFDLGVYGVPETLLINPEGVIVYRYAGLLTAEVFEQRFLPLLPQAGE